MIKKYVRRNPTVLAVRYNGNNVDEIREFVGGDCAKVHVDFWSGKLDIGCTTLVAVGDYVVKDEFGVKVYSNRVFEDTFIRDLYTPKIDVDDVGDSVHVCFTVFRDELKKLSKSRKLMEYWAGVVERSLVMQIVNAFWKFSGDDNK